MRGGAGRGSLFFRGAGWGEAGRASLIIGNVVGSNYLRRLSDVNEKIRKVGYVDVGLGPAVDKQSKESVISQVKEDD